MSRTAFRGTALLGRADPEAAASTPIVRFVDRLAKNNKLQTWQRPPIPEYHDIEKILGGGNLPRALRRLTMPRRSNAAEPHRRGDACRPPLLRRTTAGCATEPRPKRTPRR